MVLKNADRWVDVSQISIPPRGNGAFESDVLSREVWEVPDADAASDVTETELQTAIEEPSEAYLMRMKTGEKILLGAESLTIGSGSGADYIIEENTGIERVHAQISPINGSYYITDMGSSAGTFIDGVPVVSTVKLEGNKVLRLADEDFIFKNRG